MADVSEDAYELTVALMIQSSQDLSATQNSIIEHHKKDAEKFARALARVSKILSEALVIDRATEERLSWLSSEMYYAQQYVSRIEEAK